MYVVIDTETTGLIPEKHSLLQAAFFLLDDDLNIVDRFFRRFAHEVYHVDPNAMIVNGINLKEHHRLAMSDENPTMADMMLTLNNWVVRKNKGAALDPIGQFYYFDYHWLRVGIPTVEWSGYLSRDVHDTKILGNALRRAKRIPPETWCSLAGLCEVFGVANTAPHTAEGDCLATIDVYKAMMGLIAERKIQVISECPGEPISLV